MNVSYEILLLYGLVHYNPMSIICQFKYVSINQNYMWIEGRGGHSYLNFKNTFRVKIKGFIYWLLAKTCILISFII